MERREFLKLLSSSGILAIASPACDLFPSRKQAADLSKLDMIAQAALVQKKDLSSTELLEAAIQRIDKVNPKINAVVSKCYDMALERAKNGLAKGRLWAAPYLIKDLTAYKDVRFTSGTRLFENRIANYQIPFIDDIERSGLIVLGKTNTPEFGLISSTESLALGPCRTPWNLNHSSGGSSGGAAAAVAARMVPAAQASDGAGSIRLPASNCGIFGLKPSRGRFGNQYPNSFKPPWELSISHAVSWSVRDSALILALTEKASPIKPIGFVDQPMNQKLKIAVSMRNNQGELPDPEVQKAIRKTMRLLEHLGHHVIPVKRTPLDEHDLTDKLFTYWCSGAAAIRDALAKKTDKDMNLWLEPWTLGLAKYFDKIKDKQKAIEEAVEIMRQTQKRTRRFLKKYDVWLTPAVGSPPPKIGQQAPTREFEALKNEVSQFAAYTPIHNVAGTPAMSVPMYWTDDDLPIGVQCAANFGQDAMLLGLAYQMEAAQPWAHRLPTTHA